MDLRRPNTCQVLQDVSLGENKFAHSCSLSSTAWPQKNAPWPALSAPAPRPQGRRRQSRLPGITPSESEGTQAPRQSTEDSGPKSRHSRGPARPARTAPRGPSSPRRDTSASAPTSLPSSSRCPEVCAGSHVTCGPQRGGLCVRPDGPVEERALSRGPRQPQRQSQKPAGRAGAPVYGPSRRHGAGRCLQRVTGRARLGLTAIQV